MWRRDPGEPDGFFAAKWIRRASRRIRGLGILARQRQPCVDQPAQWVSGRAELGLGRLSSCILSNPPGRTQRGLGLRWLPPRSARRRAPRGCRAEVLVRDVLLATACKALRSSEHWLRRWVGRAGLSSPWRSRGFARPVCVSGAGPVSDEPRLARLGQEYLFEQVDRVLWLSKDVVLEEQDALVVLRGLRAESAALVGDGLRHLFLERNRSGLFPCFQGLFLAVGLPELRTFDGPQAPALEPALRGRSSSAHPMGRSHAAVRARAAKVDRRVR